jgi:hypothetical protein
MKGWISLHRKILDNPILTRGRQYSRFEAFVYMLLKANHKDNKALIGNNLIIIKKGSFITSQKKLMKEFNWGSSRLRTFLKLLESDGMIETNTNTISTHITINNYKELQGLRNTNELQTKHKQTANKLQTKTNNNVNNDNNVNKKEIFIKKVFEFKKEYDKETLDEFIDYWTEKNMSGTKMKYEMQKTFDVSRRLKRWVKNSKDWNVKPKSNISEYKTSTSGHYIGYCDKCNESSFYKEFNLKGDSACCSAKILPERKI